jgi:hypothetical protein
MKKAEEAAKRAPKSEIEQIHEAEKQETLRKGISFHSIPPAHSCIHPILITISMYLCIYVSMYLCIYVSMYLCIYLSI